MRERWSCASTGTCSSVRARPERRRTSGRYRPARLDRSYQHYLRYQGRARITAMKRDRGLRGTYLKTLSTGPETRPGAAKRRWSATGGKRPEQVLRLRRRCLMPREPLSRLALGRRWKGQQATVSRRTSRILRHRVRFPVSRPCLRDAPVRVRSKRWEHSSSKRAAASTTANYAGSAARR